MLVGYECRSKAQVKAQHKRRDRCAPDATTVSSGFDNWQLSFPQPAERAEHNLKDPLKDRVRSEA
jgi:hypothetical protein